MNVAIILNYRAPAETIVCAESLLAHCGGVDRILVVDNNSEDGSVEKLQAWEKQKGKGRVTVLVSAENKGYAGGNNLGIRWALEHLAVERFWIVNNDAYVESDAFRPLLGALKDNEQQFVGSVIINARDGNVECFGGGKLYPLVGKAKLLGKGQKLEDVLQKRYAPDYLMGCSLAFSFSVVNLIGLMDESYFMYSEEVDWQYRGRGEGISIRVIPDSHVYHEGSRSLGNRSAFYHYYRNRAAVRFNKRFHGVLFAFFSACILSVITIGQEFKRPKVAWSGIKGSFQGVMMRVR